MILKNDMKYDKKLIKRSDGDFYNLAEVKMNNNKGLEFDQIDSEKRGIKLFNIAHLRLLKALERGVLKPVVIVWDAFAHDVRTEDYFVIKDKENGTVYLSLNSFISYHLRYLIRNKNYVIKNGSLVVKNLSTSKDKIAKDIILFLEKEERIKVFMDDESITMDEVYENIDEKKDLIAVGNIGFPSWYGIENNYPLVFNSSFFLLEEEDFISVFSLLGDPYNIRINKGVIETPPLYNRFALLLNHKNKWEMKKVFLRDLKLKIFKKERDLSKFVFNMKSEYSIYTRYYGVNERGRTNVFTPENEGNIDFAIVGRSIVGMKFNGGIEIPQNGFVFSIPVNEIGDSEYKDYRVDYSFLDNNYLIGIQCGPGLVKDGEIILKKDSFVEEEFFRKLSLNNKIIDYGVVPTDFVNDIDKSRAARMVLCIDENNNPALLAVESVNKGFVRTDCESTGATLLEMAKIANEKEYKFALNLDGGGSTNIQYLFGQLICTADRRGLNGVVYERMIPNVGVFKE